MKLTLRSLLAYIDNLLTPSDTSAFEQLLSENENASFLCKRIRTVMNKPELGSAEVLDTSPFSDPNMMAEYLDNVLSAESSPDFERTCLTLDRQLAEVAACHQILTVVQVAPANVDLKWRQQVYQLPQHACVPSSGESVKNGTPVVTPAEDSVNPLQSLEAYAQLMTPAPEPAAPTVSGNRLVYWLGGVLVLLAAVWVGISFLGGTPERTAKKTPRATVESDEKAASAAAAPADSVAKPVVDTNKQEAEAKTKGSETAEASSDPSESSEKTKTDAATGSKDASVADSAVAADTESGTEENGSPVIPDVPGAEAAPAGTDPADQPETAGTAEAGRLPAVVTMTGDNTNEAASGAADSEAKESTGKADGEEEAIVLKPPRVGYLINSNRQVLLQKPIRGDEQYWRRMPEGAGVDSNSVLLALPEFWPTVQFGSDVKLQLIGPARLRLLSKSLEEPLKIQLDFGKLLVRTEGTVTRPVILSVTGLENQVEVKASGATLTLETRLDPESAAEPVDNQNAPQVFLVQLEGESAIVSSSQPDIKPVPVKAQTQLEVSNPAGAQPMGERPAWLKSRPRTFVADLWENRTTVESVVLKMRELFADEKKGPSQTMVNSMALVGDYEPLIDVFKSTDRKRWTSCFSALQMSVLSSGDMAADVKKQLETQMGDIGSDFFDLLWRYQGALSGKEAMELVSFLEDDSMSTRPLRIAAFLLIDARLPVKFAYRPEDPTDKDMKYLQTIRPRVQSGLPAPNGASEL